MLGSTPCKPGITAAAGTRYAVVLSWCLSHYGCLQPPPQEGGISGLDCLDQVNPDPTPCGEGNVLPPVALSQSFETKVKPYT